MKPRRFFVTSGRALSRVSRLNAFDRALLEAGIGNCNLVPVSSIIPGGAEECGVCEIPAGSIVFVVIARMEGSGGEELGAGIAWGWERSRRFGLVVEAHDNIDSDRLRRVLEDKLRDMAEARGVELVDVKYRIESLKVPDGYYGSVIAALVFPPVDFVSRMEV